MSVSSVKELVQLAAQWGPLAMTAIKELREIDSSYRVPHKLHDVEMNASEEHHKKEIKLAKEQHKGERMLTQQLFFMQTYTEFQRQAVQLDADLVNAQKEAERDMYDQRNNQLQTLVVSVTVMFAALSTVIVEGRLSPSISYKLKTAFYVCNGISFAFLFVCLVICIELLILASRFMVNKAKNRFRKQNHARIEFQLENEKFRHLYQEQTSVYSGAAQSKDTVIEDPWWGKKIESASDDLIQKRRDINGSFISKQKETFEFFWDNYCEYEAGWAIVCFYSGTGFMLLSIVLYMLGSTAGPLVGGYVGSAFIIGSLGFGFWVAWRTQKIYAGELKIRVKLPSPKEHTVGGAKRFFPATGYPQEWRDGEIVGVHDDGNQPTFRVTYGDKKGGKISADNVPLRNLRLMKQKGVYKNVKDVIKKNTKRIASKGIYKRRKHCSAGGEQTVEQAAATYATPVESRDMYSTMRSTQSLTKDLELTLQHLKECKMSDGEECYIGERGSAHSDSSNGSNYDKMIHIV